MTHRYVCREEHREDLTDEVHRMLREQQGVVVRSFGRKPRPWAVIVYCSQNHKNIFEGEHSP